MYLNNASVLLEGGRTLIITTLSIPPDNTFFTYVIARVFETFRVSW